MRIRFTMQAPDGERFAPTAFDSQIGKVVPVLGDAGVSRGTLLEAEVAADGASAELTVEGDLRVPEQPGTDLSFSLRDEPVTDLAGLVPWLLALLDDENMPDLHLRTCQTLRPVPPETPAIFGGVLTCDCGMVDWWLRDAEAKRQLVDLHGPVDANDTDSCRECSDSGWAGVVDGHTRVELPCPTLRRLALPYADRPGYRDEWRP